MYSHSQKNIEWRWAVTRECALERLARFLVAPQPVTRLTLAAAVEHAYGVTVARVKAACYASWMGVLSAGCSAGLRSGTLQPRQVDDG